MTGAPGKTPRVHWLGPEGGPKGLWVHGWMGRGSDGAPLAAALGMRLCCPDLPGHGDTPLADWTLKETVRALAGLARDCAWAGGYSMGARLLMMSAAEFPEAFGPLVLESAFPGYAAAEDREDRRRLDAERASELRAVGVRTFCRDWYRNPMWGGMAPPRRTGDADALAGALERFSSGRQPDFRPWLRRSSHRILWLAGRRDSAYAERAEWVRAHTRHQVGILDAGHAAHLVCPEAWAERVKTFLTESHQKEQ